MGDLSTIGPAGRRAVNIRVQSCWRDHRFQGQAVLPAVEAMQVLADQVRQLRPGHAVNRIGAARFDKFLNLPETDTPVEAYCDVTDLNEGAVRAALLTRSQAKSAMISRVKTHAQVDFMPAVAATPVRDTVYAVFDTERCFSVDPHRLYNELVPFGPAYRNIRQPLLLHAEGALAVIRAPEQPPAGSLGSPFVLDAAFHAACVWSQRFAGVVAFPVGLGDRRVIQPTRPGESYMARVLRMPKAPDALVFDIRITDADGVLYEMVRGVRMRDVSGGRLKPPDWIRLDDNRTVVIE